MGDITASPMPGNPDPYDDRDEDSGRFRRRYPDDDFIDALAGKPFVATSDIADCVGCAHETAYKTLQRLSQEGRVEKHEVGASAAWSLADNKQRADENDVDDKNSD